MVSELTWKNGASPSAASALTTPPPVPRSSCRSSEIDDAGPLPRLQMLLDLIRQVMHVDHRAFDPGVGQAVEHVIDQRLAADPHQRLGELAVEWAHAGAETRRQHHGAVRDGAALRSSLFHAGSGASVHQRGRHSRTCAPYQSLSGASAGCASERCK